MTDDGDGSEPTIDALHSHLAATAERPVERTASRYLGEAEAVAADLVDADVPATVRRDRLGHVERLLGQVGETGDGEADRHVAEAKRLVGELLDRSDETAGDG